MGKKQAVRFQLPCQRHLAQLVSLRYEICVLVIGLSAIDLDHGDTCDSLPTRYIAKSRCSDHS
ncbi:hypothetical protein TMatcc_000899 [Talaromyces marneffei ATCC 18224]